MENFLNNLINTATQAFNNTFNNTTETTQQQTVAEKSIYEQPKTDQKKETTTKKPESKTEE